MNVLDMQAIERDSKTSAISELVQWLASHLGTQATAYVTGLQDAKMVSRWAAGRAEPRPLTRHKLRYAYTAARMIHAAFDEKTVEAWFFGTNAQLDDEAPAYVLRHAQSLDDLRLIVPAAKTFARAPE